MTILTVAQRARRCSLLVGGRRRPPLRAEIVVAQTGYPRPEWVTGCRFHLEKRPYPGMARRLLRTPESATYRQECRHDNGGAGAGGLRSCAASHRRSRAQFLWTGKPASRRDTPPRIRGADRYPAARFRVPAGFPAAARNLPDYVIQTRHLPMASWTLACPAAHRKRSRIDDSGCPGGPKLRSWRTRKSKPDKNIAASCKEPGREGPEQGEHGARSDPRRGGRAATKPRCQNNKQVKSSPHGWAGQEGQDDAFGME